MWARRKSTSILKVTLVVAYGASLCLQQGYVLISCCLQASASLVNTNDTGELFWLSEAQAAVLAREFGPKASPAFLAGVAGETVSSLANFEAIKKCFKSGKGMTYDEAGEGVNCGVCRELAVWTRHFLVDNIKSIPGETWCIRSETSVRNWIKYAEILHRVGLAIYNLHPLQK
jgi:hypothetical protein